jgi:hypothetical protein
MQFRFKLSFDQWRLLAIFVLAEVAIFAPPPVALPSAVAAIAVNLWLLHDHVFIRVGRFTWGNTRLDV